jgi:hypothetical protein
MPRIAVRDQSGMWRGEGGVRAGDRGCSSTERSVGNQTLGELGDGRGSVQGSIVVVV